MNVDFYYMKVNLIVNLVRDYFSLKQVANVGVLFSEEQQKLKITCNYGMAGQDYSMDIEDLLEEENIDVMLKMLITQLKAVD